MMRDGSLVREANMIDSRFISELCREIIYPCTEEEIQGVNAGLFLLEKFRVLNCPLVQPRLQVDNGMLQGSNVMISLLGNCSRYWQIETR
jgi:hypothetical protein